MSDLEIFADVSCPFTHVGLRRLVDRRRLRRIESVRLRLRAWPLELANGEPTAADLVVEEIDALRAQVAPDLFTGFDPSHFPTTSLPALALAAHAYDVDVELGEQVSLALRWALFEEGKDIGDAVIVDDIARAHGLAPGEFDTDSVVADWEAGRARGVVGSPHFFAPGLDGFCPTLAVQRVDGALVVSARSDALDRFLDHCLAS